MAAAVLPSQQPFADPFEPLAAGIAVADADSRIVQANPAFIEMTGLASWRGCPISVLGTDISLHVARVHDDGAALTLRGFELATRDPPLAVDLTISSWRDRGLLVELHARASTDGDVTPRISHSLRGLAHEVKNPLAGLRGAAQLLKRRLVDAGQIKLADLIIGEADRLVALTDRLLMPGGKPHLSSINLHEVAERARALIAAEAAPELRLDRDYDPSLPPLRGVGDRLLQLVLNLLRNSLQSGAKNILVRTRAVHGVMLGEHAARLALRMDVVDDGCGVPEELRETLFLPLVSGRAGGSGLGLALAQEIAREHRGQLVCHSRPGRTVFSLTLPVEPTQSGIGHV